MTKKKSGLTAAEEGNSCLRDFEGSVEIVSVTDESDEATYLLHHRHSGHQPSNGTSFAASNRASHSFSRSVSDHWDGYVAKVETHPLLTKSITATIILGLADLCAQGVEHTDGIGIDWPRAARFAAFGLLGAPWSHYYFHWLDHYLPPSAQPWTPTTAVKVCIDQLIQAPILLAIMIAALSLMKGAGFSGAKRDLGDNFFDALIANCKTARYYNKGNNMGLQVEC